MRVMRAVGLKIGSWTGSNGCVWKGRMDKEMEERNMVVGLQSRRQRV